jgi:16S rRNA (uracil1498-N3)-methyltransferase
MDLTDIRFPRFFADGSTIIGDDAKHICTVLRMKAGDKLVLCASDGFEYPSEIVSVNKNQIELKLLGKRENDSEPKVQVRLFQCLPKGDKLDFIVQKATELGAAEIIPVISRRCVSRPASEKRGNKILRLEKIAEAAAKQSGRGKIPVIHDFTEFNAAMQKYKKENTGIIFYENGGTRLNEIFMSRGGRGSPIDVFIGSEGGFEESEIEAAKEAGLQVASLGKRILRTETAPIAALAIIMNLTGEN